MDADPRAHMVDITRFIEILGVITLITLLVASLYMSGNMYICDAQTCKAFQIAGEAGATGTVACGRAGSRG